MRILLAGGGTGGHLMPALALAGALRTLRPDVEPVLIGAARGIEADVLPRYPFRYHLLPLEPLYRRAWWRNARWLVAGWRAWRAVGRVLRDETPAVVVGTGGYAAGPVVWRAQRRGLPTAVHEANAVPGLATRWLARRARLVLLGFPEARDHLRPGAHTEVLVAGNPISPPERGDPAAARRTFDLDPARPTVLVVGGSQGARRLNHAVAAALDGGLLDAVNVLWSTGTAHFVELERHARPGRVAVRGFLEPMAPAYRAADVVVARSGAMTVAELCAWGKPAVLVPLPTAAADHQTDNARALVAAGAAVLLPESALTPEALAATVTGLVGDAPRRVAMAAAARARGRPGAAAEVASKILTLAP